MRRQLVLLPGLACDEAVWQHTRGVLEDVAAIHIAHYGPLDSLPDMAAAVLREVAGEIAVAGHSMGGRVALEMIRQAPDRVVGLALLDTGVQPLPAGDAGARETAARQALLDIARHQGMAEMAREWVRGMVHPARLEDHGLIDGIVAMFARSSAEIFEAQVRALLARPDAGPLLWNIRCPTLVLCGEQDSWAPAERHRKMAADIPSSHLVLVPECGHMCTLERPEEVTGALLEWLAGTTQRVAG